MMGLPVEEDVSSDAETDEIPAVPRVVPERPHHSPRKLKKKSNFGRYILYLAFILSIVAGVAAVIYTVDIPDLTKSIRLKMELRHVRMLEGKREECIATAIPLVERSLHASAGKVSCNGDPVTPTAISTIMTALNLSCIATDPTVVDDILERLSVRPSVTVDGQTLLSLTPDRPVACRLREFITARPEVFLGISAIICVAAGLFIAIIKNHQSSRRISRLVTSVRELLEDYAVQMDGISTDDNRRAIPIVHVRDELRVSHQRDIREKEWRKVAAMVENDSRIQVFPVTNDKGSQMCWEWEGAVSDRPVKYKYSSPALPAIGTSPRVVPTTPSYYPKQ